MNTMNRFKISTRLFMLLSFLLILLVILGFIGITSMSSSNETNRLLYEERLVPLTILAEINRHILQAYIQGHLGTKHDPRLPEHVEHSGHPVTLHTDNMQRHIDEINRLWIEFLKTQNTEENRKVNETFESVKTAYIQKGLYPLRQMILDGKYYEVNVFIAVELRILMEALEKSIDEIVAHQTHLSLTSYEKSLEKYRSVRNTAIFTILAGIFASIGFGYLVIRSVLIPLKDIVHRMKDIAEGEGDLRKRVEYFGKDELKEVTHWINEFINRVHEIVKQLASNFIELDSTSKKLTEISQSMSAGVEEMSRQSEIVAASATQMNQNLLNVSSAVQEMSITVSEVAEKAENASTTVNDTNAFVNDSNREVSDLGEEAKEISKVTDTIKNIADQTNLLALNAAIEAASAGEAGKGFAVVASEVKNLSRSAGDSSEEIKSKISGIQERVHKMVRSMGDIVQKISHLREYSSSIAASVEEQSIASREISRNIEQSTIASNEVTRNINAISQALKEGARNAHLTAETSVELKKLSESLGKIVSKFKI